MPRDVYWTEQRVVSEIKRKYDELGRIPQAKEVRSGCTYRARIYYGSWKNALMKALPEVDVSSVLSPNRDLLAFTPEQEELVRSGVFRSRKQVYDATGGRSRAKTKWLNENNILFNYIRGREDYLRELKGIANEIGRTPRASDCPTWLVAGVQRHFGTWNEGIYQAFGELSQNRYDHLSTDDLLLIIRAFVLVYRRLPNRDEFDGKAYPHYSAYLRRLSTNQWGAVLGMVDLEGVQYYSSHGSGRVIVYGGTVYLSKHEYLIGKYLTEQGVSFLKEVPYGGDNEYVFDFYLPEYETFIEYYGMATSEYQKRISQKRLAYNGRNVIEIFKHDNTVGKLATEVQRLQSLSAA